MGYYGVNPPPREPIEDSNDEMDEDEIDWSFVISNERLYELTDTCTIKEFVGQRQVNWISHVIRRQNSNVCKILTFHSTKRTKQGRKTLTVLERAVRHSGVGLTQFVSDSFAKNNRQVLNV